VPKLPLDPLLNRNCDKFDEGAKLLWPEFYGCYYGFEELKLFWYCFPELAFVAAGPITPGLIF
jgi:hypothetical protein